MFTWICPQCGREVPPSYTECPTCAEAKKAGAQPAAAAPPPPAQPQTPAAAYPTPLVPQAPPMYTPAPAPPQAYAPQAPPQQVYRVPDPHARRIPGWLVTVLVAGGLVGIGVLGFTLLRPGAREPAKAVAPLDRPPAGPGKPHPYLKFVEVTGIRLLEEKQKLQIKLAVVNHSAAELSDMKLTVTLSAVPREGEASVIAEIPVSVPPIAAFEVKDVTASVPTKLRAYEVPDWQFLKASFVITAP